MAALFPQFEFVLIDMKMWALEHAERRAVSANLPNITILQWRLQPGGSHNQDLKNTILSVLESKYPNKLVGGQRERSVAFGIGRSCSVCVCVCVTFSLVIASAVASAVMSADYVLIV